MCACVSTCGGLCFAPVTEWLPFSASMTGLLFSGSNNHEFYSEFLNFVGNSQAIVELVYTVSL